MKSKLLITLLFVLPTIVLARPDDEHVPPTIPTPPPVVSPVYPIQDASGQQCDEYQLLITSARGKQQFDSQVVGYCDHDKAIEVMNKINANSYINIPKGKPVYYIAYPLFN